MQLDTHVAAKREKTIQSMFNKTIIFDVFKKFINAVAFKSFILSTKFEYLIRYQILGPFKIQAFNFSILSSGKFARNVVETVPLLIPSQIASKDPIWYGVMEVWLFLSILIEILLTHAFFPNVQI